MWKKWLGITLGLVLLLAVGAVVAVSVWTKQYLRSPAFRELIGVKTGDAFKARASYAPLTWSGSSVFSDSLDAAGHSDSPLESLQASQIRAEVNWRAIFEGAWRVDRIDALRLDATFRPATDKEMATPQHSPPPPPPKGFLWLPQRFELGEANVAQSRIVFRNAAGAEAISLKDGALQIRPEGDGWVFSGRGGSLNLPKVPQLAIESFRSRLQNGILYLTNSDLRLGATGKISASGTFADESRLLLEWSEVDVAPFLDPNWRARLSGTISGNATLEWPETGLTAGKASGRFVLTNGLLQDVGTLNEIATFTGAPQFKRMPVQEFSADFTWTRQSLILTNIIAESKGLLRLEGKCTVMADGTLDSALRVGVTPQTLQWIPGSRERVFTRADKGYLWTDMRVTGTITRPQEDLSIRLVNAMKDETIDTGVRVIESLPGAANEGVRGIFDVLKPVVP